MNFPQGIMVSDVVKIRPINNINYDYIMFLLNSPLIEKQIRLETSGSTRKRLNLKQVKNLKIKLPSYNEQEKIASFLSAVDKKIVCMEKKNKELYC